MDIGMGRGRGASLFPAVDKIGKEGYVIGIDSSEMMVRETYKDILSRNRCNAEVKKMNAQYLELEKNAFDNVICGFGLGYILLSENKLNGIIRVLKNVGEAGFSIWGIQEDQKWLTDIINKYLLPVKENKSSAKADIPKFDTVEDIVKIFHSLGFKKVKVHQENVNVIYKDKDEWWQEMWTNAVRVIFEQIEDLGCSVLKNLRKMYL